MRRSACLLLAACLATPAYAQSTLPSPDEVASRDTFTVGLGAGIVPDYEGSDDYKFIPAGAVRGQYHGISFSTRGLALYVDFIPRASGSNMDFDLGPIAGLRLNRTGDVDDEIMDLLPERDTAVEVGGFAGVSFHGLTNPYDKLALRLDVTHDVADAHESTIIGPAIEFSTPLSRTTYVGASVGADFVGGKYADYYFSVSPVESALTLGALPVFDADGGMKSWEVGLLLNQSLSGDLLHGFSLFGAGQYSKLVGDFKDSPIVSDRGSASQWMGAVGLAYTW